MRKTNRTCLAAALVIALPALLHGQEAEEPKKKEKRAQLIVHANYVPELPSVNETAGFTEFLEQGSTSRMYSGRDRHGVRDWWDVRHPATVLGRLEFRAS